MIVQISGEIVPSIIINPVKMSFIKSVKMSGTTYGKQPILTPSDVHQLGIVGGVKSLY